MKELFVPSLTINKSLLCEHYNQNYSFFLLSFKDHICNESGSLEFF